MIQYVNNPSALMQYLRQYSSTAYGYGQNNYATPLWSTPSNAYSFPWWGDTRQWLTPGGYRNEYYQNGLWQTTAVNVNGQTRGLGLFG